MRDNARNIEKAILMIKTSSVPRFIDTFQLVFKYLLFKNDRMNKLLAKVQKIVWYFGYFSKASEMLKKIPIGFEYA